MAAYIFPVDAQQQQKFQDRFAESSLVTYPAKDKLEGLLEGLDLVGTTREHLAFLYDSCVLCAKLCSLLNRYMDIYMEADSALTGGKPYLEDIFACAERLVQDADRLLGQLHDLDRNAFDPLGGIILRQARVADLVSYSASQIMQSLEIGERIPTHRRDPVVRNWW